MIDEILQAAGFIENVTYIESIFVKPPQKTFVVYFDDIDVDGSDFECELYEHSIRFELYALNKPDKAAEKRLEKVMKSKGIHYQKVGRVWIQSERYYLTTYYFDYIEKE